jgi:hypothetical protein
MKLGQKMATSGSRPSIQWSPWFHQQRSWLGIAPKRRRHYNHPASNLERYIYEQSMLQLCLVRSFAQNLYIKAATVLGDMKWHKGKISSNPFDSGRAINSPS